MQKKMTVIILVTMLVTGLVGCGSNNTKESVLEKGEKTQETDKTLVVYYSSTGNTTAVAEVIAQHTKGDLFELVPAKLYTKEDLDWTESNSRVSVEHDNSEERVVELAAQVVDNWDEYNTIYIGYPIWWGIAAWPVDTFLKANDFSDKTVIPFATAASSELGESGELLQKMAGTGDWMEGKCFHSSNTDEEIEEWVNSNQ